MVFVSYRIRNASRPTSKKYIKNIFSKFLDALNTVCASAMHNTMFFRASVWITFFSRRKLSERTHFPLKDNSRVVLYDCFDFFCECIDVRRARIREIHDDEWLAFEGADVALALAFQGQRIKEVRERYFDASVRGR